MESSYYVFFSNRVINRKNTNTGAIGCVIHEKITTHIYSLLNKNPQIQSKSYIFPLSPKAAIPKRASKM